MMKNKIKFVRVSLASFSLILLASFMLRTKIINKPGFYGEFKIIKTINFIDSFSIVTNYIPFCNLYSDSVKRSESWKANSFGTVSYNSIPLKYNSSIRTYLDTVERRTNTGVIWNLTNSNICQNFTISCSDTFPSFANYNFIPNQLRKTQNFCLNFSNINYADEIEISMWDGQLRTFFPFNRKVTTITTTNSLIIPACDLQSLIGKAIVLTISLVKFDYQIINGKRFRFEKRLDFKKPIPLTN